jgi:hypothetical protein
MLQILQNGIHVYVLLDFSLILGGILKSFLVTLIYGRLVHAFLTGSSLTARVAGGCPQGRVLSLLLWNLVDELLVGLNDQGLCAMGYADDIVIIAQGKFTHPVRELMQAALNEVVKWTTKEELSISPQKTVVVPFTNKRNIEWLRTSYTSW